LLEDLFEHPEENGQKITYLIPLIMTHKIFISHIQEEKALAATLKQWIESTFPDKVDVFVSSDEKDLPPGTKWLDKISEALHEAQLMILLCSPTALRRPWINFEAGCAWTKQIPLMPICHSGQTKSLLPSPISSFQGIDLESEDSCPSLIQAIAKQLHLDKVPRIDYKEMRQELLMSLGKIATPTVGSADTGSSTDEPSEEELQILVKLARFGRAMAAGDLAVSVALNLERVKFHMANMVERKLVSPSYVIGEPTKYGLSQGGRKILFEKKLI
jgi:hypothetical protein